MARRLTRRKFLVTTAAFGMAGTVTGCPRLARAVQIWKRAGRGRRISNAAKSHNANILYATQAAALNNPAHPGDRSGVVPLTISAARHTELFGLTGAIADLRHL